MFSLEKGKAYLRPIEDGDTPNIVRWRNSQSVRDYFIIQDELTPEIHRHWLETKVKTGEVAQFIIVDSATDQDVGTVYLRNIDRSSHNAEFGIYLGEPGFRSKGLGRYAAYLICRYGFDALELHHITLRVLAENSVAIQCYQSVGFRLEGKLREQLMRNGRYQDILMMGMLKEELAEQS